MNLPLFSPPLWILILLNALLWTLLHLCIAWGTTLLPSSLIRPAWPLFTTIPLEYPLYRFLRVKRWKGLMPDGAAWFSGGFAKKRMTGKSRDYLHQFVIETCRGELVHWFVIICVPLFFLFNPRSVWWIHLCYALLANLPCILIQRYNRPRLRRSIRS